ncbi:MAG TPA: pyrroloquinoline quinone biosynthesis protein PqqE [Candidatus Acidoferrum sp.]|nr:pyrroloquinoline quinone biosynthesis protein PqqE [Candidatus Acidoferrum sp.]
MNAPLALIAELTHRCPLHCVYCSNPRELAARSEELPTEVWARVFAEAAAAGVMQLDLTGGEPLARPDLTKLIQSARAAGLYVNLITSGLPLDEIRLDELVAAGLDHFQLSFQGAREETANEISGTKTHAQKLKVLGWLKSRRVAVTLNFVLHRNNLDQLNEMLSVAENSSASRIEFAHVQYYGWAFANRDQLLPSREQLMQSLEFFKQAEERLRGKIKVEYVVPDYYAKFPKPCMGGWGRKAMLITPRGDAMPCHAASVIPGLRFDNVKDKSVKEFWESSEAFQKFRGETWMQEPCKSCDRRTQDFGGCRCQAMLLAGNAAATDPVCSLSPERLRVDSILAAIPAQREHSAPRVASQPTPALLLPQWLYRPNPQ